MVRPYLRSLVSGAAFIALVAAQPALADVNTDANALFVKAVQTWDLIQAMPADDPALAEQRLDLIAQVNADLDTILTDLPGSDIAVRLVVGEVVGSFDIAALRLALADSALATANLTCAEAPTPTCLIAAAVAVLAGVEDQSNRELATALLVDAMALADDPHGALLVMEAYPLRYTGAHLHFSIVQAFGRLGQQDRAAALIDGLEDQRDRSLLLAQLGVGLAEARRTEDAVRVADQIAEPELRAIIYTALGDFGQAEALIETAQTEMQDSVRVSLAIAAARAGEIGFAQTTIGLITRGDYRPYPTREIALAHARAGQVAEAIMILRRFPELDNLALALWRIDPDPAYVAELQTRLDRTPAVLDSRIPILIMMNITDPRPAYQAELDARTASMTEDQRRGFNAQSIRLLSVAGRYADAAAIAFAAQSEGAEAFDHIRDLIDVTRAMATDPLLN